MIVALEGPDCAGKSTLFEALRPRIRAARFVQPMPLPKQLMPVMPWVEERQLALWTALYDSKALYVCDRHVAVSAPVYDEYFGRPCVCDWRAWTKHVRVLYLEVPLGELHTRYAMRGDERFDGKFVKLQACYARVLPAFRYMLLDGTLPVKLLAEAAAERIGAWWLESGS